MEAGQIHMIGDGITIIEGNRLAARPGIKLLTTETGTFVLFWVDVSKPPFNNRTFRHALYHALPKKAAVEIVLGGASVPARRSPLPPSCASGSRTSLVPMNIISSSRRSIFRRPASSGRADD